MWVLDHQRDLAADFRTFYRLSPAESHELPGPEYLALAYRTGAYQGVIAALAARQQDKGKAGGTREVESSAVALSTDPVLRDLIEM